MAGFLRLSFPARRDGGLPIQQWTIYRLCFLLEADQVSLEEMVNFSGQGGVLIQVET